MRLRHLRTATQLVITLDGPLSEAGMAEGVPLSQLQARLTAYEQRIVDIIESTGNAPQQSQTSTAQPRPTSSSPTAEPEASTTADTSAPSSTVEP
ncbi:MAG: hypothetical protein H0U15_10930 [Geodermatophilaceae bacterium]|nr:hypothetical protein [Geodermatophilaceae bacterium]